MSLHKSLKTILPFAEIELKAPIATITESDDKAKVREAEWINSSFVVFEADFIKRFRGFFEGCGANEIMYKDCDGVVVFEKEGKKYMFFTELKSTFSTQEIFKAKDQIISSYIKINMILNLLPNYNRYDYIIKAFIVSLEPKKSFVHELKRYSNYTSLRDKYLNDKMFAAGLVSREKRCVLKPTDCESLKGMSLGDRCLFNELEFHHISVPQGSYRVSIDVDLYT